MRRKIFILMISIIIFSLIAFSSNAGVLSTFICNEILDHILKTGSYSQPTNLYIALFDGIPGDGGTECSGTTYDRVVMNDWTTAASRTLSNNSRIEFAESGADWGDVNYVAIYDADAGGNLVGSDDVYELTVVSGDDLYIPIGDLDVTIQAGDLCTTWANKILDHIFKNTAITVPTNLYVGYATATPQDDASGLAAGEPSGDGYARKGHNVYNAATSKLADNNGEIEFDAADGGAHGTITYFFLSDHLTNQAVANIIFYGALDAGVTINDGDNLSFPTGDLNIDIDG